MKLTRRFLALLLAFSMSLSMVTPAFASEVETVAETEAEAVVEEIAAVEAEAVNETVTDATDASTEASVEAAEASEEATTEAPEETEPEAGTSEDNPIWPEWTWNDAQTEASVTVTVPAGETRYVAITFGGMQLSVNGGEASETTGSFFQPQILPLTNDGEEAADYELVLAVPAGTMSNPEALSELGWIDVSLAEGDGDGYYYTYTAEGNGTATFYIGSITEGVEADIVIYNQNTYVQKTLLADGVDNYGLEVSIDVNAGDVLNIQVVVLPDADWNIAAADITWVGSFAYALGSEQNPIMPEFIWNEEQTEATATVTVPVGTTYYGVYGAGMLMSINNGEPFVLTAANPRMPAVFAITNDGEAAAEYTLTLSFAVGSRENPEVIWDPTTINVSLAEGDSDGYFYSFANRAITGTLVFTPSCTTEGVEYDVVLTNMATYDMVWLSDSTDGTISVETAPGDMFLIQVVAMPDENYAYPAAEISLNGEVVYPEGSRENPAIVWDPSNVTAVIAEGDNDGYFYSFYNRAATGTLIFTPTCATEGVEYDVVLTNMTTYEMAWLADSTDGTVSVAINPGDTIVIQVVTMPDENWVYPAAEVALNGEIVFPVGSSENPEVVWDLSGVTATLAEGDNDGYFYSFYNRAASAELVLAPTCATEGVAYDVVLTNMSNYAMAWLSDSEDGTVSISINPGDLITIQVVALPDENWVYPAAEIALNGEIVYPLGSSENPEIIWDPTAVTAVLAEGDNDGYYYSFANRRATGTLVFAPTCATEGVEFDVILTNMNTYEMVWLSDSADGTVSMDIVPGDTIGIQVVTLPDENWVYPAAEIALNGAIVYPLGSEMNPDTLSVYTVDVDWDESVGQNIATVEANNWSGYLYTWTADADGELTITMSNGKAGWSFSLNNLTSYIYCDSHYSCDTPAVTTETIAVKAGDEIQLVVNSCGNEPYGETPAGDVYFNATFVKSFGTIDNPYLPEWNWNDAYTEATAFVTVPAGVDTYYIGITSSGMLLTINGGEPVEVNGSYWFPETHELTNGTDEDVIYELCLYFPEGTMSNPADIEAGTVSAELAEGSQGAYYTFIAPDNGEVTVTINEGETGWQYFVNNMTSFVYGDYHWSDEEPAITSETLTVNKGDELQIFVVTYDPNSWTAPAGTVSFDVSFEAAEGTETNPIMVYDVSQPLYATIPAYATVHYNAWGAGGMWMYVPAMEGIFVEVNGEIYAADGVHSIAVLLPNAMGGRMPVAFSIINETDSDLMTTIDFVYPIGSMNNPDQMILGKKNTANVDANDMDGYLFSWIATGNGVLEVSMNTGKNWTYVVNNLTAGFYGDMHWSDDAPVVKKDYIAVSKGDEIQIMVNTYDPESWNTPAGKIEFTPKLIVSYTDTLLAGKNMTLKYLDDAGKTVSASKVEWTMEMADGSEVPSTITLKAGKLTAAKTITEPTKVIVTGIYEGVEQKFNVTIYPAATSVTVYDAAGNDVSGDTLTLVTNKFETWPVLSAEVAPNGALNAVTWKSSNTKVVNVDANGNVYPVSNKGTATITATAADGSGKKATVKISVTTEVQWIDVTSKTGFYTVGAGKALTMVANTNLDAVNQKVTWSIKTWDENSENLVDVSASIATINSSGKLTAAKGLTDFCDVCVIATAQDGSNVSGECWVTVQPIASSVAIYGVPEGNTYDMNTWWPEFYLSAETLDAQGNGLSNDVTWKSSSDKIATIDEWGTVFCVKPGTVTFTATANDGSGKKAAVKITIVKSPTEIQLPSRAVVAAGKTLNLSNPIVLEADASNKKLNWTWDDPEAAAAVGAKVNNGKVTVNAKLVTEPVELSLTATAVLGDASGYHAADTVIVMIYPATKSVSIMGGSGAVGKSLNLNSGDSIVLYAETAPANAAGKYSWTSSDAKVATVENNPDGSVTVKAHALKNGKATITATAVDGTNKKASVTVNVKVNAEAVEMDRQYVVAGKSVDLSKQIRYLDYDGCAITPVSKNIKWSLWVQDEAGNWAPAENNKCAAGTLNAKNGKFTAGKVAEWTVVIINVEYVNDEGETIGFQEGTPIEIHPTAATIPVN